MEDKLKQLEDQDIIEEVTGPTTWVSPLVIVDKPNGDIQLCVNMCKPNEALRRTHHPYPTSEETLQDLNGSKFFSKIDNNVRNIVDDILVLGTTKEENDRSLENVLLILQEKNGTVNPTNCLFGVTELD